MVVLLIRLFPIDEFNPDISRGRLDEAVDDTQLSVILQGSVKGTF
jgi:hypothetical protein